MILNSQIKHFCITKIYTLQLITLQNISFYLNLLNLQSLQHYPFIICSKSADSSSPLS